MLTVLAPQAESLWDASLQVEIKELPDDLAALDGLLSNSDESTVRKLTRRIGAEAVTEMTRALIVKAARERRFGVRAVRIDSTVVEADVTYPTDAGLAGSGASTAVAPFIGYDPGARPRVAAGTPL